MLTAILNFGDLHWLVGLCFIVIIFRTREWSLSQDILLVIRLPSIQRSLPSRFTQTALCAAWLRVCCVTDLDLAVQVRKLMITQELERRQAKLLTSFVIWWKKLQGIVYSTTVRDVTIINWRLHDTDSYFSCGQSWRVENKNSAKILLLYCRNFSQQFTYITTILRVMT